LINSQKPVYDASKPLNLRFKVLQDYLREYEQKRAAKQTSEPTVTPQN